MTVSSNIARQDWVGNGTLASYPFTFEIYTKTDIKVYVSDVLKTVDVHYTIAATSIMNPAGGNIVFTGGNIPALNAPIAIILDLPLTQLIDYIEGDKFPAETHERALDRIIKIAQSFKELSKRTLKVGTSSTLDDIIVPVESGGFLAWNDDADAIVTVPSWDITAPFPDHHDHHENAGADEISLTGLTGDPYLTGTQIDVRAYGATGDGVTDDTISVQNAVDALPAGGGVIFFPPGTYIIDQIIIGDNTVLKGVSRDVSIIKCTRTVAEVYEWNYYGIVTNEDKVDGNDNITVRDLKFWRTFEYGPGNFDEHIFFYKCRNVVIKDCYFLGVITFTPEEGHSGKGISLEGCLGTYTIGNIIDTPDSHMNVHTVGDPAYGGYHIIAMNEFRRATGNGTAIAITMSAPHVVITQNIFRPEGTSTMSTETREDTAEDNEHDMTISNNLLYNSSISIGEYDNVTITGNVINVGSISWRGGTTYNIGHGLNISGNIIKTGAITGYGYDNITINSNKVYGNSAATNDAIGILGVGTDLVANVSCIGNLVENAGRDGISIQLASNADVSHNTIKNSSRFGSSVGRGIFGAGNIGFRIAHNSVIDVTPYSNYAVQLAYCSNVSLLQNDFAGWLTQAIYDYVGVLETHASTYLRNEGNSYNYIPEGNIQYRAAAPTSGTWHAGTTIFHNDAAGGAVLGWLCITSGTFSAATDATGDTDGSTAVITGMADTGDFQVGQYVTVSAGFASTGPYLILAKTSATITINASSNAVASNITVSTPDPVFKTMAVIQA